MSFGRPPSSKLVFSPTPPERGSFPLDHDGECRDVMKDYLACLKKAKGTNEAECRLLAKGYLKCRMDRGLMAQDEFRNLGFQGEGEGGKVGGSRLEELRRENEELVRRHMEEKEGGG